MKYNNEYEYAGSRLNGTVVRSLRGGYPLLVHNIDERNGNVDGNFLRSGNRFNGTVDQLNVDPIPLGYSNINGEAHYIMRMPRRDDWRQGMRSNNIVSSSLISDGIIYKDLVDCIVNKYPTVKDCINQVGYVRSVAFSRKFAIDRSKVLFYKGKPVGSLVGSKFVLKDKFKWVKEQLFDHCGGSYL